MEEGIGTLFNTCQIRTSHTPFPLRATDECTKSFLYIRIFDQSQRVFLSFNSSFFVPPWDTQGIPDYDTLAVKWPEKW